MGESVRGIMVDIKLACDKSVVYGTGRRVHGYSNLGGLDAVWYGGAKSLTSDNFTSRHQNLSKD